MMCEPAMEIKRDKHGFYTLYIDGVFDGNYDSYTEAAHAYEQIQYGEALIKELVSA